ncbi:MAG TPA: hypothetical protein VG318_02585 [Actinomycetota bacterium]|nr:hypothetical protein [Actinomycetota bacterium]
MVKPQPEQRKPPVDERYRMFLRIVVVVIGFGAYLVVQRDELAAGVMVGAGIVALGWAVVDRYTLWRREQSEMLLVGQVLLGIGLVAIGLFLYLG